MVLILFLPIWLLILGQGIFTLIATDRWVDWICQYNISFWKALGVKMGDALWVANPWWPINIRFAKSVVRIHASFLTLIGLAMSSMSFIGILMPG
jgi:hypothetical protein